MLKMKTLKTVTIALFLCLGQITFAQESIENPTGAEDIKVVTDYIDALTNNKMDLAASLMADDHIGAGPSANETETKAETMASWTENHKVRTNHKNDYVSNSFRVVGGDLEGDWVSVWGTYTFTQNSIDIELPYQYTGEVKDGKIKRSIIYYDKLAINIAMGYELTAKKQ
jgi:ketosteroid isomerase-like protein